MLDKSIPYKNIIMRADSLPAKLTSRLPQGFTCKAYVPGDEQHWAEIETSVGEFDSPEKALAYHAKEFLPHTEKLKRRCRFIIAPDGSYVATCTAWTVKHEGKTISVLHWLAVRPDFQRKGLARFLVETIMRIFDELDEYPVYLHTQTWSHTAVLLYCHTGFKILKTECFDNSDNDYSQAMAILKDVISQENYLLMLKNSI